jgi:branched-chain amino acid transport system permease protein
MVRDDPVAAEGLGVSTKKVSILFFSLSAGLAGIAGGVFAGIVLYVDPTSFTLETSILVLSMIAIGGLGNPYGVLLGGLVISFLPQLLRQLDLASGSAASLQQIIYGLALIVIMIVRPVGLLREQPVVRIGERAA